MESISNFFDHNIVIVFFFYGLAFFSMGLAVWMEAGRSPDFKGRGALLLLAGFGMVHGVHEWLEVFTLLKWGESVNQEQMLWLELTRVLLLVFSFLLLIMYGLNQIAVNQGKGNGERRGVWAWTAVFGIIWLASSLLVYFRYRPCAVECLATADVLGRYFLAVPGALLAAWAMMQQQQRHKALGRPDFAGNFAVAGAALLLYGVVGQLFTRPSLIFPSTVINAELFRNAFGIPVQLFRGLMAVVVAIFVIRTLRALEVARRQKLAEANQARLAAQEEALMTQRKAQEETEALNRELQSAVQDLAMLFDLSRSLAKSLDRTKMLNEAINNICDNVRRVKGGMILLRSDSGQPLQVFAKAGYEQNGSGAEESIEKAIYVGQEVVARAESLCWTGVELLPTEICPCTTGNIEPFAGSKASRNLTIGMPILVQEENAGSLVLSIDGDSEWLTANDLALVRTVASQVGMAVSNALLYEKVQAREALRGELLQRVTSAQEQERQRIARELHDGVGQRATALGLGLAAASDIIDKDPDQGRRQLMVLREMTSQLVLELQVLIAGLRPTLLDDLGLVAAVRGQLRQLEAQAGVSSRLVVVGHERRLGPDVETAVFRIAQEGLNNVAKHAQASSILVQLDYGEHDFKLTINDDGRGFDTAEVDRSNPSRRLGLLGIRERVAIAGGTYAIDSAPGAGTKLWVGLPLSVDDD